MSLREVFAENPDSAAIATRLNAEGAHVCPHNRDPCHLWCGVRLSPPATAIHHEERLVSGVTGEITWRYWTTYEDAGGTWRVIPLATREAWLARVEEAQRRDAARQWAAAHPIPVALFTQEALDDAARAIRSDNLAATAEGAVIQDFFTEVAPGSLDMMLERSLTAVNSALLKRWVVLDACRTFTQIPREDRAQRVLDAVLTWVRGPSLKNYEAAEKFEHRSARLGPPFPESLVWIMTAPLTNAISDAATLSRDARHLLNIIHPSGTHQSPDIAKETTMDRCRLLIALRDHLPEPTGV